MRTDPATEKELNTPVVPEGFNEKALEQMNCPENGSRLRFATRKELNNINDRIGAFKMKSWGDAKPQSEPVGAVLVRADNKIGYRVEGTEAILRIEEALVLDDRVGLPNPKKNFK
jgi:hypothetical protein